MNVTLCAEAAAGFATAALAVSAGAYLRLRTALRAGTEESFARTAEAESRRDEAERRFDELAAEYDALVAGCGAGVMILDGADVITRASAEACRMFGAGSGPITGRSLLQLTLSSDLNNCLRAARENKCTQTCEFRSAGANGAFLNASILPVGARFLVIARDVTELRRLETVRRDFVANVSHELRTPLTSIRAMAETLQDGAMQDGDVADRFLSIISTEAQRLTRISEDLLILSHVESRPTEMMPVGISDLAGDVAARFKKQAEQRHIAIACSIEPSLRISGSPDQIEQVLINLIDNAIKYTPEGGKVCVKAEGRGDFAAISVSDTGIGIMAADLPRIFERFYRVDKARSRQSGGTGLGLSIVKHIVEAHGGIVTVESEYNRGSTFTFSLPGVLAAPNPLA